MEGINAVILPVRHSKHRFGMTTHRVCRPSATSRRRHQARSHEQGSHIGKAQNPGLLVVQCSLQTPRRSSPKLGMLRFLALKQGLRAKASAIKQAATGSWQLCVCFCMSLPLCMGMLLLRLHAFTLNWQTLGHLCVSFREIAECRPQSCHQTQLNQEHEKLPKADHQCLVA